MKGMTIGSLTPIAVTFVVAFFALSIGSVMLDSVHESFCDYTYYEPGEVNSTFTSGTNPTTGAYWGCCQTTNASANSCVTWYTDSYSINTTYQGNESLIELADWGPTLALVIIAAIIIGVLITYLGKS